MSLFQRISRVLRANINDLVGKAEDPAKQLEQIVIDLSEAVIDQRQAVAEAIASYRQLEEKYNQHLGLAEKSNRLAVQFVQRGDERSAIQCLAKKQEHSSSAQQLLSAVETSRITVDNLRQQLTEAEQKLQEAKTKKDVLKAQYLTSKAQDKLNQKAGNAMTAFANIEEKILLASAKSEAMLTLDSNYQESQLIKQLSASNIDSELMAIKAQLGAAPTPKALPSQVGSLSLEDELRLLQQQVLPPAQPSTNYQGRVIIQTIEKTL